MDEVERVSFISFFLQRFCGQLFSEFVVNTECLGTAYGVVRAFVIMSSHGLSGGVVEGNNVETEFSRYDVFAEKELVFSGGADATRSDHTVQFFLLNTSHHLTPISL